MNSGLDEACAILDAFEKKIADVQRIWVGTAELNPDFEQVSPENWQEKYHRMWLHGAADVWECYELERWLIDYPSSTILANSPAKKIYTAWRKWLPIAGPVKVNKVIDYDKKSRTHMERESKEPSESFYADHDKFEIQKPLAGEILYDYVLRLAQSLEEEYDEQERHKRKERESGDWLGERALKSFLDFIRKQYPVEQVAFIEHVFPKKMELYFGRIIRHIPLEAYPIPEKTAAEILIALAKRCRNGRSDARHTALESLVLCMLCIACSRVRLPKTLEDVKEIYPTAILSGAEFGISKNRTFGQGARSFKDDEFSVLQVPTWFGDQPLKISNRIAALLRIIARIPSKKVRIGIFQKSRKSLDQTFNSALQAVTIDPKYGNITYSSLLMNQPHIHGDHRQQPNYMIIK